MRHLCFLLSGMLIFGSLSSPVAGTVIVTDTFSRTLTGDWGDVDNGLVDGENGTMNASYTLDNNVSVDGSNGRVSNNRAVLDYNLAADADVIAGGGFIVEWRVNPGDGDPNQGESGTGREFAGIGFSDSNQNPPYGGAGAITNVNNTTLRYALFPRNSGSAGFMRRAPGPAPGVYELTAGGNPSSGFNEEIFDQVVFDDYVNQGIPDPFANSKFYDVKVVVMGDFSQDSLVTVKPTVNGVDLATRTIQWGSGGQAYVSAVAFNGPHQYDDLKITAIPEPSTILLGCVGLIGLARRRRS